jgi:preprotein translocase subunit SecF
MVSFDIFTDKNYKSYLLVPVALFIIFAILIFVYPGLTQGFDLKGGTTLNIRGAESAIDAQSLENTLRAQFELKDLSVLGVGNGAIVQFAYNETLEQAKSEVENAEALLETEPNNAKNAAQTALTTLAPYYKKTPPSGLDAESFVEFSREALIDSSETFQTQLQNLVKQEFNLGEEVQFQKIEVGPALGELFWDSAIKVFILALVLVIIVIFLFFREIVPSFAVIVAAILDIMGAMAGMSLFGIGLSLASIPAILMLVGYSVDTDILLTTRLLKRKEGTPGQRAAGSMKTGLTMTLTTLSAVTIMLVVSWQAQMLVVFEVAAVLMFGLITDLLSTWFMNAPILLWYAERKEKRRIY